MDILRKRIAVIGSGIAGLTCTSLLAKKHDISLFEANNYLGGHTHTVTVQDNNDEFAIDTGFIVFNHQTYPNFTKLLHEHQISYQRSEMSFSFRSLLTGFEFNPSNLITLCANWRNLTSKRYYQLISDIVRFNREATRFLLTNNHQMTIADYIKQYGYSEIFIKCYLLPVASAIWSTNAVEILDASAHFIFSFYQNHGLLSIANQPQWYTICGGSKTYIPYLIKDCDNVHLNEPVLSVERHPSHAALHTTKNSYQFDAIILAVHSDQALQLLTDADENESSLLSSIPYQVNDVTLHTDSAFMPNTKRLWASWNYTECSHERFSLTYYMNRLQRLSTKKDYFVSVNLKEKIDPSAVIEHYTYAHPVFTQSSHAAQQQLHTINGKRHTYFCGAYFGYGFHEDGVNSALTVANLLGQL